MTQRNNDYPSIINEKESKILDKKFPAEVVKERPITVKNGKGLMASYVDARDVMKRLDEAVGKANWSDNYQVIDHDTRVVQCFLTVNGIQKSDVGYPNGPGDEEPYKSSFSDALKRAAVKFGIGHHLYDGDMRWVPVNDRGYPETKKPTKAPTRTVSAEALDVKIKNCLTKLNVKGKEETTKLITESGLNGPPRTPTDKKTFIAHLESVGG